MLSDRFADLSSYQLRFDPVAYRAAGCELVALKATEGLDWVDPYYAKRAGAAHGAGLQVWHYHFAHPDTDPGEDGEAAHFWRTVQPHFHPGDRLVLDLEVRHPDGAAGLIGYTRTLDGRLHHISGQYPVGYSYLAMIGEAGAGWQVASGDWWVADYGARVYAIGAGRRIIAQQVTDRERFAGVGWCDGNVLRRPGKQQVKAALPPRRRVVRGRVRGDRGGCQ